MDLRLNLAWFYIFVVFFARLTFYAVGIGGIVLWTYCLLLYSSASSSLVYGQTLVGNITIYDTASSRAVARILHCHSYPDGHVRDQDMSTKQRMVDSFARPSSTPILRFYQKYTDASISDIRGVLVNDDRLEWAGCLYWRNGRGARKSDSPCLEISAIIKMYSADGSLPRPSENTKRETNNMRRLAGAFGRGGSW